MEEMAYLQGEVTKVPVGAWVHRGRAQLYSFSLSVFTIISLSLCTQGEVITASLSS